MSFFDCAFARNTAYMAAGMALTGNSGVLIERCAFTENAATVSFAGGMLIDASTVEVRETVFRENSATQGGAIYVVSGTLNVTGSTFAANAGSYGGAIANYGGAAIAECTFYGNTGYGCDFYQRGTASTITRTIMAFSQHGAVLCQWGAPAPVLTCCDIYGHQDGDWIYCIASQLGVNGNISADPLFCNAAEGDFSLAPESPCRGYTPENPECDRMGAWQVGCVSAAEEASSGTSELRSWIASANPTRGNVRIAYLVSGPAVDSPVRLELFDSGGRLIRQLIPAIGTPGVHVVEWDGREERGRAAASGVYFFRLAAGAEKRSLRILLLR